MRADMQALLIEVVSETEANILLTSRPLKLYQERLKQLRSHKPMYVVVSAQSEDLDLFISQIINQHAYLCSAVGSVSGPRRSYIGNQSQGQWDAGLLFSHTVAFTADEGVRAQWGMNSPPIHLATAVVWLHDKLGYKWSKKHRGMFVDGHERTDVVDDRQNRVVPAFIEFNKRSSQLGGDNMEVETQPQLGPRVKPTLLCFHDESTFYAHD